MRVAHLARTAQRISRLTRAPDAGPCLSRVTRNPARRRLQQPPNPEAEAVPLRYHHHPAVSTYELPKDAPQLACTYHPRPTKKNHLFVPPLSPAASRLAAFSTPSPRCRPVSHRAAPAAGPRAPAGASHARDRGWGRGQPRPKKGKDSAAGAGATHRRYPQRASLARVRGGGRGCDGEAAAVEGAQEWAER
eukprot:493831-Prorocentrum_minimum.AAC.4